MEYPEDLRYTKEHEWARLEEDGTVVFGITEYASHNLGDIVFVEFPEKNAKITKSVACGVVESVKAVADLFSPVSGTVLEVNSMLATSPEIIGEDPYGEGWFVRCELADKKDFELLMNKAEYENYLSELD